MNILALDLGTRTGWALSEGGRIESGVHVFDVRRGESPGMRYVAFNRWLQVMGSAHVSPPVTGRVVAAADLIVFEMPHLRGGAAATVLAGFQTRVEEFCAARGIEHVPVHSATLKKWTTGSGRGDKTAMRHAVHRKGWMSGREIYDDNEVDAIALLHYAIAEIISSETGLSGDARAEGI